MHRLRLEVAVIRALLVGPGPAAAGAHFRRGAASARGAARGDSRRKAVVAAKDMVTLRAPRQTRRALFAGAVFGLAKETHTGRGESARAVERSSAPLKSACCFASVLQYASFDWLWPPRQTQRARPRNASNYHEKIPINNENKMQ